MMALRIHPTDSVLNLRPNEVFDWSTARAVEPLTVEQPSTHSYLIPKPEGTQNEPALLLETMLQELVDAQYLSTNSAKNLIVQGLEMVHSTMYMIEWGGNVANYVLRSLNRVCSTILKTCQDELLLTAIVLDANGGIRAGQVDTKDLAAREFRSAIKSLRSACCTINPTSSNLLWDVQIMVPAISKLSSQIDTCALEAQINLSEMPQEKVPNHLALLAHLTNFNLQVHQVITSTQSILNVMSDWQDRLAMLVDHSAQDHESYLYEDQVRAAIVYWQNIQNIITKHLTQSPPNL